MNLIDLDPHLHFHMELLLYLNLAPDLFMLQPSLDLIPFRQGYTRSYPLRLGGGNHRLLD